LHDFQLNVLDGKTLVVLSPTLPNSAVYMHPLILSNLVHRFSLSCFALPLKSCVLPLFTLMRTLYPRYPRWQHTIVVQQRLILPFSCLGQEVLHFFFFLRAFPLLIKSRPFPSSSLFWISFFRSPPKILLPRAQVTGDFLLSFRPFPLDVPFDVFLVYPF